MSGRVGVEQTPDIETVLAEHEWLQYVEYGPCTCGDRTAFTAATHRAHIAQALAPVLAAERVKAEQRGWDDGAVACVCHEDLINAVGCICQSEVRRSLVRDDRADRIAVDAPEGGA